MALAIQGAQQAVGVPRAGATRMSQRAQSRGTALRSKARCGGPCGDTRTGVVVRAFLVDGDGTGGEAQSDFQRRMREAGIKYDRGVDDFANWVDKGAAEFIGEETHNGGGGGNDDGGEGGGDDSGGGGDDRRRVGMLPWITGWGALLYLSYVAGEWKGYGHFTTAELVSGLALCWGLLWTAVELFKIAPHPQVYGVGLGMSLGSLIWTCRRASDGFWDKSLTVNAIYSLALTGFYGQLVSNQFNAVS